MYLINQIQGKLNWKKTEEARWWSKKKEKHEVKEPMLKPIVEFTLNLKLKAAEQGHEEMKLGRQDIEV